MLVDQFQRPLRDLRVSVTDRCNFRCGYCMPKDIFGKGYPFLKSDSLLPYDYIQRLVRIFVQLGVRKIRLTGGEPLLRHDLEDLIKLINNVQEIEDIALTTNASILSSSRVLSLYQAGVKRLNISLDALTPEIYAKINQIKVPLEDILDGVKNALDVPFKVVKINMVVQKNINESEILPMAEYFRGTGAVLRFIEFMDVGNHNKWNLDQVFTAREIIYMINQVYPIRPVDANCRGEVAKRWQYVDGKGEIGVISSVTQPFCTDCARARLSAKGELFTCLFATSGYNIRPLLDEGASDYEILKYLESIWVGRKDRYSMQRKSIPYNKNLCSGSQKVEMSYIGG